MKAQAASIGFRLIITAARPMILIEFLISWTKMLAKTSLIASTSLVRRVTILPTGVMSKKRMVSFSTCAKRSSRMPLMISCPVRCISQNWARLQKKIRWED